jgi:hypothetical protein
MLGGRTLFSTGDVVAFLECEHATRLALTDLEAPIACAEDDGSVELIQQKGFAYEAEFLSSLIEKNLRVVAFAFGGRPGCARRRNRARDARPARRHLPDGDSSWTVPRPRRLRAPRRSALLT